MIKITNLYKRYNVKPQPIDVLFDINLEIHKGDFAVIFGPSGSGKSTLLNIMLGLERPTRGDVRFLDVLVSFVNAEKLAEFRKQNIGIVYQQPYWIKSLDVIGNVAFPLSLRGIPRHEAQAKALAVLEKLGMSRWATFKPMELSAGQQQKVSLARALVTDPNVIIADEPTGNLDYKSGQDLSHFLRLLNDEGKTIIMVTHNLDNLDYAKRVIHIFDGHIVEDINITEANVEKVKKELIDSKKDAAITSHAQAPSLNVMISESEPPKVEKVRKNIFTGMFQAVFSFITTILLSILTLVYQLFYGLLSLRFLPEGLRRLANNLTTFHNGLTRFIAQRPQGTISYADIFDISFKNLIAKRYRTFLTVGGVALGIGFTAFLVSLGFGLEKLVISQVTQLEELRQIDVYPSLGETVVINDEAMEILNGLENLESALPVIGIAGNVNYEDSNTDIVVYGVQADYLKASDIQLLAGDYFTSNVLGTTTDISGLKDESLSTEDVIEVRLPSQGERKVVVNQAFLELIGLDINNAVSKTFKLSYIVLDGIADADKEIRSLPDEYTIAGVVATDDNPVIFAPISNVRSIGIPTFTRVRLITEGQDHVGDIRQQLNVLGFRTTSVLDTVSQIEDFFASARVVFALVGMVALVIASLGMFNTLTVSLLERIREVGLMKAIGMQSLEVKDLFLTEAVIMGLLGGVFGIIFGVVGGFLVSAITSLVASSSGMGFLNLVYLPPATALIILTVAALTGIATGLYPAKRATRVSPLDALRYE